MPLVIPVSCAHAPLVGFAKREIPHEFMIVDGSQSVLIVNMSFPFKESLRSMARLLCPLAAYFLLITLSNIVFQVSGLSWNQVISNLGAANSAQVCNG